MNSCNTDRFLATTVVCGLSTLKCTWLWIWLPYRLSAKRQSQTTVLLRTPITQMTFFNQGRLLLGPVSRKSRELFGPEKLVVKLQSACFEKLIFLHVFNIRKTKRIAKFDGSEPRRCKDIKGIVAPEIDPKSFGTFEKRAPGLKPFSY